MIQRCAGCHSPSGGPLCNLERWAESSALAGVYLCPDKRLARLRPLRLCLVAYCKRDGNPSLIDRLDREVEISKRYWEERKSKVVRLALQPVAVTASSGVG